MRFAIKVLAPAAILLLQAGTASAATYDLKAQWSNTFNPNGPWSLLQGASLLPRIADWTPISNTDPAYNPGSGHIKQVAFAQSATLGSFLPAFFKAAVTPAGAGTDWLKGDLIVHPTDQGNGAGAGVASAVFTNPAATVATISGYAWNARNQGRPQAWQVTVDGMVIAAGSLPGDGSVLRATKQTFVLTRVALPTNAAVAMTIYETGTVSLGDYVGFDLKIVTQ